MGLGEIGFLDARLTGMVPPLRLRSVGIVFFIPQFGIVSYQPPVQGNCTRDRGHRRVGGNAILTYPIMNRYLFSPVTKCLLTGIGPRLSEPTPREPTIVRLHHL